MYSTDAINAYRELLASASLEVKTAEEKQAYWYNRVMGALRGEGKTLAKNMLERAETLKVDPTSRHAQAVGKWMARRNAGGNISRGAIDSFEELGRRSKHIARDTLQSEAALRAHPLVDHGLGPKWIKDQATGKVIPNPAHGTVAGPSRSRGAVRQGIIDANTPMPPPPPKPVSVSPGMLAGGALGAAGIGTGGYLYGQHAAQEKAKTQRNIAFGAGAATGLAAPYVLKRVAGTANQLAMNPSSLFNMGGY